MNYRILKTVALMSIMFGVTIIFSAGGESGNAATQSFKRSSVDRAGAAPEHGRAMQVTTHVDDTGSAAGKTIAYAENPKPRVPTATQTADEKSPAETGEPAVDLKGPAENRDEKDPLKPTEPVNNLPVPDRRWILKMKEKGKPNPPVKEVPIEWKDKNQKIRCEAYLSQIHEAYKNAKYFSIAGDACNTGRYADQFLQLVHACEKDCPENLLAKEGYKDILIKNVETLLELGRKKCLQEGLAPPAGEENKNETN